MSETIFALSTPPGRSGVAVIRVSGPRALDSARVIAGRDLVPRIATLCTLRDPVSRETIDKTLVIGFEGPASFTGEDSVEYHVHGGLAIIDELLAVLSTMPHHRMAEPGEFTKQAFVNGKLDLTEAEAIADLIDAQTRAQKTQALRQMGGVLSRLYEDWTDRLKKILAHLEADIEFPDEDLPEGILPDLLPDIEKLMDEIEVHLNDGRRGERLRDGVRVAVIGPPNAGKSSLVNMLAQRDVAIVSDIAGTTRDVIEVHLDLDGLPILLSDTAGLRPDQIGEEGQDYIESQGIARALDRAAQADIKVLLFDGAQEVLDQHTMDLADDVSIMVVNKADDLRLSEVPEGAILVSVRDQSGVDQFIEALTVRARDVAGLMEAPSLTRARHRENLTDALEFLSCSLGGALPELVAEDLRMGLRSIGRITGRVDVEELLDVIFKDFCIGK